MESALARERLDAPGLRVVISELKFDPMRPRGPLAAETLRRYLAEKFEAYLREGWVTIELKSGVASFDVVPPRIALPRLLGDLRTLSLPTDPAKRVKLDLYFDPSGRGRVAIRHHGVTVVEDVAALVAYGLEESAYAQGFVRGFVDADFLQPLPARSGFDENADWIAFLDLLDRYRPTLEAELDAHLQAYRAKQSADIGDRALRIARDILDLDEFRDLALPGGLSKRRARATTSQKDGEPAPSRRRPASVTRTPGDRSSPGGSRMRYEEVPFESGSTLHSRFASGVVQANTLHPDYQRTARSSDGRLAYAALMIGKETVAYNDRSGRAGDYLEKLLDFYFKLQTHTRQRRPGRTAARPPSQRPLDLTS